MRRVLTGKSTKEGTQTVDEPFDEGEALHAVLMEVHSSVLVVVTAAAGDDLSSN